MNAILLSEFLIFDIHLFSKMVTVNINDIHAASSVSMEGKIWKFLKEQHNMGKLCDAVILCGDSKFMAHRFVLAAVSPYFRAQILGSFNNTTEDGVLLLALHDFSATSINLFLDLVYEEINVKDIDIVFNPRNDSNSDDH